MILVTSGLLFHFNSDKTSRFYIDYTHWDDFLAIWKLDLLIMISTDEKYAKRNHTYTNLEEAMLNYPDHVFVALEPDGDVKLRDFEHPTDNIIYILGDNNWKGSNNIPSDIQKIRIDTPVDSNARPLRDFTAAMCLIYDRTVKL